MNPSTAGSHSFSRESADETVLQPRLGSAFRGLWWITLRSQFSVRRLPLLLALVCSIPVLAWFTIDDGQIGPYFDWTIEFYLFLLLPLYCLSVCGALIRDELQADTLGFFTTRPLTRARLFILKFLSQIILLEFVALASALLILGVGVSRSIPGIREFAVVFLMGQSLAVLAYGALSALFGLFTQRYMVLGIVYGFIVEFGIGQIPTNINNLSISRHLRTILANNSTMEELYRWPQDDTWISVLIMGGAPLVFLLIAAIIFTFKEYHHSDDMQK